MVGGMRVGRGAGWAVAMAVLLCAASARGQDAGAERARQRDVGPAGSAADGGQATPEGQGSGGSKQPDWKRARRLFRNGVQYANQERWGEALEYFRRSRELVQRPSTLFNIGVALLRLGRPTEALRALERYLRVSADMQGESSRRAKARRMLEVALQQSAHLEVRVDPPSATLRVDGERVAGDGPVREVRVDPGEHKLEVTAPGHQPRSSRVALLPGERTETEVTLQKAKPQRARLVVTSSVPGAHIALDGERVGRGTWSSKVEPGPHQVRVTAAGYEPFERRVGLEPGGSAELHAALREKEQEKAGVLSKPVFWISAAAAAAAIGVGVGVGVAVGSDSSAPYPGNTGVVLQGLRAPRGP